MKKLIKNIALVIVAIVLSTILFPLSLIWEIVMSIVERSGSFIKSYFTGFIDGLNYLLYQVALTIDRAGSIWFKRPLNWAFLKELPNPIDENDAKPLPFGTMDTTGKPYLISYILGFNFLHGTLSDFGFWFKEFLDLFEKEHIIKAD